MFGKLFFKGISGGKGGWRKGKSLRFFLVLLSILLSSILLLPSFSPKHEYHVSVTHMQFNPSQKSFEVSIRIFTDDLEKGLSRSNGNQRFVVKDNDKNDELVEKYIRKGFVLTDANRNPVAMHYVGKEQEEDATWIYLEIPFQGKTEGYRLQNSTLLEVFDDQVNMTNLKLLSDKKTFLFKKGQTIHAL